MSLCHSRIILVSTLYPGSSLCLQPNGSFVTFSSATWSCLKLPSSGLFKFCVCSRFLPLVALPNVLPSICQVTVNHASRCVQSIYADVVGLYLKILLSGIFWFNHVSLYVVIKVFMWHVCLTCQFFGVCVKFFSLHHEFVCLMLPMLLTELL